MSKKKYIIVNFLHGNGPYLRTTELAVAVNDSLEKRGLPRLRIIVPWVYKLRQYEIIKQNFQHVLRRDPNEILLDRHLGELLGPLFYNEEKFEDTLNKLLTQSDSISRRLREYFAAGLKVENLAGEEIEVSEKDIVMEINRCPLLSFGVKPSYYTGFGYMSEILEKAMTEKAVAADRKLLKKGSEYYKKAETDQALHFIAEPATFAYLGDRPKTYADEIMTPPNSNQSLKSNTLQKLLTRRGAYVTITGVYSRAHLFNEMYRVGLKIYTHKPSLIQKSRRAAPSIILHKNILLQFARIGWGSAWLSFFTRTPLITMPFYSHDDPEVYFNNVCIEKVGLGKIYNGESVKELLNWSGEYRANADKMENYLLQKYGTVRGVPYTAEKIAEHFLSS
ncbi:MAG: hypothetical protein ABH846_01005 [Patescibacteria group bacterium]